MRLQKYLSQAGVASRRGSEKLILDGRVLVDGKIVDVLGTKVDESSSIVEVDGKVVDLIDDKVVLMLNKPLGVVTTMKEQFGRPCVADFIDGERKGVFPVGRLDYDTSGLLLLTNDGDLAAKLMHPSTKVQKTYVAGVKGRVSKRELDLLRDGVELKDFKTEPAKVKLLGAENGISKVEISIHEGKNRQVRRMFGAIGKPVFSLIRTKYAHLNLKGLEVGELKKLGVRDVLKLKSACLV